MHTPGPWKRIEGDRFKHDDSAGVTDGRGTYIACALDMNRYDKDEEVEANARLIAKAPALLDACESIFAALETEMTDYARLEDDAAPPQWMTDAYLKLFELLDKAPATEDPDPSGGDLPY